MAFRIMILDMVEFCCLFECRNIPIQMPKPFMDSWVSMPNIPDITLEVLDVNGVETNNGWKEADINLCKLCTKNIWSTRVLEYLLNAVEGAEKSFQMIFVYFLNSVYKRGQLRVMRAWGAEEKKKQAGIKLT